MKHFEFLNLVYSLIGWGTSTTEDFVSLIDLRKEIALELGVRGLGFKFFYLFKIYKVLHVFDKYNNYKNKI